MTPEQIKALLELVDELRLRIELLEEDRRKRDDSMHTVTPCNGYGMFDR